MHSKTLYNTDGFKYGSIVINHAAKSINKNIFGKHLWSSSLIKKIHIILSKIKTT